MRDPVIVSGDFFEMRARPCRNEVDVLNELFAGGGRKVITHAAEMIGRDLVFSHIVLGLGHEPAGTTGKREHAVGIPPEIDLLNFPIALTLTSSRFLHWTALIIEDSIDAAVTMVSADDRSMEVVPETFLQLK